MTSYTGALSLTEEDRNELHDTFEKHEFRDFSWIDPTEIVVSQWVRLKCEFGCEDYGRAACPPNLPSISECQDFFREYTDAAILHFKGTMDKPEDRHSWSRKINAKLLKLALTAFLRALMAKHRPHIPEFLRLIV